MSVKQDINKDTIDFIGIGAAKCGTTWLAKCLEEHPDILMSSEKSRKELSFFNTEKMTDDFQKRSLSYYDRGLDWYLNQFPKKVSGKIRGEFSTSYMRDPVAAQRIKEFNPNVKIIAILRNPINMINSTHWFRKTGIDNKIPESISEALDTGHYIEYGKYYKHLSRYYKLFSKSDIRVIILDQVTDFLKEIQDTYRFLGVSGDFSPPSLNKRVNEAVICKSVAIKNIGLMFFKTLNNLHLYKAYRFFRYNNVLHKIYKSINIQSKTYPKLEDSIAKRIRNELMVDIENLEKLLNKDLSSWK